MGVILNVVFVVILVGLLGFMAVFCLMKYFDEDRDKYFNIDDKNLEKKD